MHRHTFIRLVSFLVLLWLMGRVLRAEPMNAASAFISLNAHEGFHLSPYRDPGPRHHWIVGVGHNLSVRKQRIRDYSRNEVMDFFDRDLAAALRCLRKDVESFDSLPEEVQFVCLHIVWSCGATGFHRFVNFRRALRYRAYGLAATEIAISKWHSQVSPERANWAVRTLKSQP